MNPVLYEKLRKIIVDAVPEIMDLKAGCFVDLGPCGIKEVIHTWSDDIHKGKKSVFTCIFENSNGFCGVQHMQKKNIVKTLGRRITFIDVMSAIQKNGGPESDSWQFYIEDVLYIGFKRDGAFLWDMRQSLSDQSDECGEFLLQLFK